MPLNKYSWNNPAMFPETLKDLLSCSIPANVKLEAALLFVKTCYKQIYMYVFYYKLIESLS